MKSILNFLLVGLVTINDVGVNAAQGDYDELSVGGSGLDMAVYDHFVLITYWQVIQRWDLTDNAKVQEYRTNGHSNWVYCVWVHPDNKYFLSGSSDRKVIKWDLVSGVPITVADAGNTVIGVYATDDYVYCGSWDNRIYKFTWQGVDLLRFYQPSIWYITVIPEVGIVPGGKSVDGDVRLLDFQNLSPIRKFVGMPSWVDCPAIHNDGDMLVIGCYTWGEPNLYHWKISTGELVYKWEYGWVPRDAWIHKGYIFVSTYYGPTGQFGPNGTAVWQYDSSVTFNWAVAVNPPYVVVAGNDFTRKWNASDFLYVHHTTITETTTTRTTSTNTAVSTTAAPTTVASSVIVVATTIDPETTAAPTTSAPPPNIVQNAVADAVATLDWSILLISVVVVMIMIMILIACYYKYTRDLRKQQEEEAEVIKARANGTVMTMSYDGRVGTVMQESGSTQMSSIGGATSMMNETIPSYLGLEMGRDVYEEADVFATAEANFSLVTATDPELNNRSGGSLLMAKTIGPNFNLLTKKGQEEFDQEIILMWRLRDHPFIAKIYGFTVEPASLIMKYYPLGNLEQVLSGNSLDARIVYNKQFVVTIMQKICLAVSFVHSKNYAHMDVKPSNVFLEEQMGEIAPVLSGFRLSKLLQVAQANNNATATVYQPMSFTLPPFRIHPDSIRFAAPDYIVRARNGIEERAPGIWIADDVYSLGMSLHQVLMRS